MLNNRRRSLIFTSLSTITLSIFACVSVGNDSNDNNNNSGSNPQTTETYLPYEASLHLVDPNNPTATPITLTNNPVIDGVLLPVFSSFDYNTKKYTDFHIKGGLFIEEDDGDETERNGGKIYKAFIEKGSSNPSPQQVSNLIDACYFRDWYIDPVGQKLYVEVETAGDDGKCSTGYDNQKYLVNMDMSSSNNPISLSGKELIDSYFNNTNSFFSIDGFLYKTSSGDVYKCDTNLQNCLKLSGENLGSSPIQYIGWNIDKRYLYVCGSNGSPKIYRIDLNNNSVVNTNQDCFPQIYDVVSDGSAIYFAVEDYSTSPPQYKIYKFSFSDERIYNLANITYNWGEIYINYLTSNYIVVYNGHRYSSTLKIWAVDKNNGNITEIENDTSIERAFDLFGYKNMIVYSKEKTDKVNYLCFWKEGDTRSTCRANHILMAQILPQSEGYIGYGGLFTGTGYSIDFVSGVDFLVADVSNDKIYLVDGDNLNNIEEIGNIPSGYEVDTSILKYGRKFLYSLEDTATNKGDIFMIDLDNKKILQITDTPDIDEKG